MRFCIDICRLVAIICCSIRKRRIKMSRFKGLWVFVVVMCFSVSLMACDACSKKTVHVGCSCQKACECGPKCDCINCDCGCCVRKVVRIVKPVKKCCDCCVVKTKVACCKPVQKTCACCKPVCNCGDCGCRPAKVVFRPFRFVGKVCNKIVHPCRPAACCECGCNH